MSLRLALLTTVSLLAVMAVVAPRAAAPASAAPEDALYLITITNISSAQPLSPPLLATHAPQTQMFIPGTIASDGLRALAEEGLNQDLAQAWRSHHDVREVIAADLPLRRIGGDGPPGSSTSSVFTIRAGAGDVLTVASMLGCTNDAFTGTVGLILPDTDAAFVVRPSIFDAGTEMNTEKSAHLPDACGTQLGAQILPEDGSGREPTDEPIGLHQGLRGNGDLNSEFSGWSGPVMQIRIERLTPVSATSSAPSPGGVAPPTNQSTQTGAPMTSGSGSTGGSSTGSAGGSGGY